MRFDKLTTKFQQALAEAQSMAVGKNNPYIESQHLLLALLQQEDGGTASLLQRSGANVVPLRDALEKSIGRLSKVDDTDGEVSISRDLGKLFNLTEKEAQKRGDQFIASEIFLATVLQDKGETAMLLKQNGKDYPPPDSEINRIFKETPGQELTEIFHRTIFDPDTRILNSNMYNVILFPGHNADASMISKFERITD